MNHTLCKAGISDWSCISGFNKLITTNTVDNKVENDNIQRYFHRIYVRSQAIPMKNEYHKRVSPIVRKGGRCRYSHNPAIKMPNTIITAMVKPTAILLLVEERSANTAPANHKPTDSVANT